MTEFDAALEFVREYAAEVAAAVRRNERLDDRSAHRSFCEERRLEPTPQRLELARDIAIAAREYHAGVEAGVVVVDAGTDTEALDAVPAGFITERLECHGWRADFLGRPARL